MNRPELYKKTVDILYDAYFNDTLRHGDCAACAVGNMIAANNGWKIGGRGTWYNSEIEECPVLWIDVFGTEFAGDEQNFIKDRYVGETKIQIDSTGYELPELMKIEAAFESCKISFDKELYMFNGLVAVLEVLKQIHEVEDNEPEVTRFKNHYTDKVSKL